jgi:hypothetical protein
MRIVYRITEKDFTDAYDLIVALEKPLVRALPWVGGLSLVVSLLYLPFAPNWLRVLLGISAFMGLSCLYTSYEMRRAARRMFQNDRRFDHDFTADSSEDSIYISTLTAESTMKWSAFIRFTESNQIFVLSQAAWLFQVFPKRCFAANEVDPFRGILQRNAVPYVPAPRGNVRGY